MIPLTLPFTRVDGAYEFSGRIARTRMTLHLLARAIGVSHPDTEAFSGSEAMSSLGTDNLSDPSSGTSLLREVGLPRILSVLGDIVVVEKWEEIPRRQEALSWRTAPVRESIVPNSILRSTPHELLRRVIQTRLLVVGILAGITGVPSQPRGIPSIIKF